MQISLNFSKFAIFVVSESAPSDIPSTARRALDEVTADILESSFMNDLQFNEFSKLTTNEELLKLSNNWFLPTDEGFNSDVVHDANPPPSTMEAIEDFLQSNYFGKFI